MIRTLMMIREQFSFFLFLLTLEFNSVNFVHWSSNGRIPVLYSCITLKDIFNVFCVELLMFKLKKTAEF